MQGRKPDLPTMIWFSELLEPAENFESFFTKADNKILDVRNVWLLNIRNMNTSDHHSSFEMGVSDEREWFLRINLLFLIIAGHFERRDQVYG